MEMNCISLNGVNRLVEIDDNFIWITGPDRLLETMAITIKPLGFVA